MRHQYSVKKLGRANDHRDLMVRNLLKELVKHGKITTTSPKAFVLKAEADKLFSKALNPNAELALRSVFSTLNDMDLTNKVMKDYLKRLKGKTSGFTTRYLLNNRRGDNAEMSMVEIILEEKAKKEKVSKVKKTTKSSKKEEK
ncbi:MAG: 50S ribosomal protein L17 [bacterium]